jgi:signal transduction histidine kinase
LTARSVVNALSTDFTDDEIGALDLSKSRAVTAVDPGWTLARVTAGERMSPLALISETPWWPVSCSSGPVAETLTRLWRHSVAVSGAARSLARNAGDANPESVARAALLCRLGCWIVAAIDPEWIVRWYNEEDAGARHRREMADLGTDLADLGRKAAEARGCEPLVVDAAWLGCDDAGPLNHAAAEPQRLALIQQACRWAEQTPWSLAPRPACESMPSEPRLRILVAEVQARCGAAFVAADATAQEESVTRQNVRLRISLADARRAAATSERLMRALADSPAAESLEEWTSRTALTWCAEPEVRAACVSWLAAHGERGELVPAARPSETSQTAVPASAERPPDLVFPLAIHGRARAQVQLWCDPERGNLEQRLGASAARSAWALWASLLAERELLERRLQSLAASSRELIASQDTRLHKDKLDALSQFAAGAGHELNNPLAVVVGRAQLLLARSEDPETTRSLRIILNQAGRAHRILRDLMFVARPPAQRPRACRPSELFRLSLRDLQGDCESRGIRLHADLEEPGPTTWADPDALRHLAEILLKNALDATPPGGKIEARSLTHKDEIVWSIMDTGKGLSATDAVHLFDPFYCGRQAGRGLGLGLPRAARIVELLGGRLRYSSNPGHGAVFHVHVPLCTPLEMKDASASHAERTPSSR